MSEAASAETKIQKVYIRMLFGEIDLLQIGTAHRKAACRKATSGH